MYSYLPYEIFSSSASVQLVRTLTKYRLGPGLYNFDLVFRKGTCFARIQEFFSLKAPRYLDQLRDHTSPSGLEASAKARTVIRVEVLMEKDLILPLRIGLKFLHTPVNWPTTGFVSQEDARQAIGDFASYLEQVFLSRLDTLS
jgi:hypothetical protein